MTFLVIPAATDAFVRLLRIAATTVGLTSDDVLDGPSPGNAGTSGVVVGASRENPSGEFRMPESDMSSSGGQNFSLTCLAWASTGDTDWASSRTRCAELVAWADSVLAADRTLGGSVSSAYIVDGVFDQEIGPQGIVVTIEFRIEANVF